MFYIGYSFNANLVHGGRSCDDLDGSIENEKVINKFVVSNQLTMGNSFVSYPTSQGKFDSRSDVILYKIVVDNSPYWEGASSSQFKTEFEKSIKQFAKKCDSVKSQSGLVILSRYFGEHSGNPEHPSKNMDEYRIEFRQNNNLGFNKSVDFKARRATPKKSQRWTSFKSTQHMSYENAAVEAIKTIADMPF